MSDQSLNELIRNVLEAEYFGDWNRAQAIELADKVAEAIRQHPTTPPLLKHGSFTSHSGLTLPDKIDCDALTAADWEANAAWVASRMKFSKVVGIPSGGLAFAKALQRYATTEGPVLIVDDVLTTGRSMEEARKAYPDAMGVVLFSRTQNVPQWITARFVEHCEEESLHALWDQFDSKDAAS